MSESADALYYMSLAGWDSAQMLGALEGVMNLAAASGEDLALVSDIVTDAMTAFGLEAEQASYFADVLAKSASSSNTSVAGLGGAFQYVAPVAGALGFTIEDTAIALGLLANQGIKGQKAGTALRRVFTNLVKPTKSSKEAMEELNIEVANSDGSMKSLEEIMLILRDRFKGLTEEQMANYAGLLAGQEGMSGLLSIVNTSEEDFGTLTAAIRDNSGAAKEMSDIMEDTLGGKLRALKSNTEEVALSFFDSMYPALDGLVDKLQVGAEWLNSLSDETKESIVQWGLLAMAGGPVLSTLGNITTGLGTLSGGMKEAIRLYGKFTTPKNVEEAADSFGKVGGAVQLATAKVTGFVTTIGGLPVVIGLAGAALLGFTAWKLWGEDAWNSAKRTREWGTDVGETVGNTLTEIKGFSDKATGQFSLMSQGLSTNTGEMSANFANMGEVIERSLKDRISKLDELIAGLPETVKASLTKILEEDKKQAEESLAVVIENNAKIAEHRERAASQNRELSIFEAKMIQDLNKQSAEAYINTLKISQQEKKTILDSMNGDVENATQEEAKIWAKNLAKQRQEQKLHYNEQKTDYLASLKELGYSPEFIAEQEKIWEAANKATTDGIDQQLANIAEKYPEIAKEISFVNGQVIESGNEMSQAMIEQNNSIIDGAMSLSSVIAATAERNAEKLRWMGDETTHAGQTWNSIILDPKTGEVKTNVREAVIEAAKDSGKWNEMRFQLHDANLDSNAKKIIGEAAVANGWWDGMAWSDKEAVLNDEFSITMYQALEETGKWNELSVKEKNAFLYSNTPEVMAQTMFDLGLWDDYQAEIKDLDADNYSILNAISQSEIALNQYNAAPVELKTLLANDPSTLTFNESKAALEAYNKLPEDLKTLLGNNKDAMSKINTAKEAIRNYNENFKPGPKHLHATTNAWEVANSAQRAINSVRGKTVEIVTKYATLGKPAGVGLEKGTNYHLGGPMIVNDQKGPMFKELVTFPDGRAFIPEGRDVFIPNAPRGTKVLKASSTRSLIPRYEKGIGFDYNTNNLNLNPSIDYGKLADTVGIAVSKALGNLSFEGLTMMVQERVFAELVGDYANSQGAIKVKHKGRGLAGS